MGGYASNNSEATNRYTLSVLVQDVDGITSRVAGMFTRRGFNMYSIVSAATETEGMSRITIVVDADDVVIEQITKQLNKLIPVLKVVRLDGDSSVARAFMLVKVAANNANRAQVVDAADIFRARVVDVAPDSVVLEATGNPGKLEALLEVLQPFGIIEMIRSGEIALNRGPKPLSMRR